MRVVGVVIPVHDEEDLLERALASIDPAAAAARAVSDVRIHVVVVLDACTDGSAAVARRWPVDVVEIEARRVGAARRAGVRRVLELAAGVSPRDTWLAQTDADSAVPSDWLTCQLALMRSGVDVMLGTVRPDFRDLSARHARYWLRTHPRGRPAGNVHGANLGIRASTYVESGGFPDVEEHEDVLLVRAARERGARVRTTDACEVLTSGRFTGRTPGGYAAFVRAVHERLEASGGVAATPVG